MRIALLATVLGFSLAGCTNTSGTSSTSDGPWRVVPLNSTNNYPDRCALLVNQQTGETWIYNSADQWTAVNRP